MCVETMAVRSKSFKNDCLRKTIKLGPKVKWRLLSVEDGEACKPSQASAVKATIRKYLRREQKRAQLAKFAKAVNDCGNDEQKESKCEAVESLTEEFTHNHLSGAMAPENTTQYLMNNVYEDLLCQTGNYAESIYASSGTSLHIYDESLSPESVYFALDSAYENCLDFQQRDFEEMYGLYCA